MNIFMYLRERSLLIVSTRAEDNFAQLEKISYPILKIEKVSMPHNLSAKWFSTPIKKSLCIKDRIWTDMKFSQAMFTLVK